MGKPRRENDDSRKFRVNGMTPWPSGSAGMAAHSSREDLHNARMRDVHREGEMAAFDSADTTEEGNKRAQAYRKTHGID
jgi:hypothetical protein